MFQSSTVLVVAIAATLYLMPLGSGLVCATRQQAANVDMKDGTNEGLNRMLLAAHSFDDLTTDGRRMFAKKRNERVGEPQPADKQDLANQQQQMALSKQKSALKKKWHRLVDELIDGELSSEEISLKHQQQPEISNSYRRKKWSATTGVDDEGDKVMIFMKRPPLYASDLQDWDLNSNVANSNGKGLNLLKAITGNTDTNQAWPQKSDIYAKTNQAQGELRSPLDGEHGRDIMNDKFGILRDSIFTTNNHLGYKGVPKFGSDEVY